MPAPTNGLILFWNMETLSSGKMDDLSTSGNDGTINGAVDVAGQVGRARDFGSNASMVADFAPAMGASFTMAAWLRPRTDGRIAVACDTNGSRFMHYGVNVANRFGMTLRTGGTTAQINASSTNSTGSYRHLALRYNGHTAFLFRDGETQASVATTGTFSPSGFMAGTWKGGTIPWRGDIDELRVYNRALSKSEIQDIFNDTTEYPVSAGAGGRDRGHSQLFRRWVPAPRPER